MGQALLSSLFYAPLYSYNGLPRANQVRAALQDGNKLITSIAFDVGFNSKSTFNTGFKKVVGYSPSAYRNSLLENK